VICKRYIFLITAQLRLESRKERPARWLPVDTDPMLTGNIQR
jgi:hypothetical protein